MPRETDVIPGLEELADAAREHPLVPACSNTTARRKRVPSLRILKAGGIILRGLGVVVVIAGFWPICWALFQARLLFDGEIKSEVHFTLIDGQFSFQSSGWFAIIPLLIFAGLFWCVATVSFAMGHALYVLRDLAKSMDDRRPPAG